MHHPKLRLHLNYALDNFCFLTHGYNISFGVSIFMMHSCISNIYNINNTYILYIYIYIHIYIYIERERVREREIHRKINIHIYTFDYISKFGGKGS